jgi:sugar phosphate isomerase/epimerase
MQAAMKKRGKRILIAATHIRRVDEPYTESLLRTLKSEGVTHYRMGHYTFDHAKPLMKQVRNYAAQAKDLAALNQDIGIQGLYQNHSGARNLGALGWDAAMMLEGIDPKALGMAFDTRHLRMDTGSSWQTAVAVCHPHIRSIYVKDGIWHGERGDKYKDVALDSGFVNLKVFNTIRKGLAPMPLCIHMEWLGYRVFKKQEIPSAIEAHQRDIATLRRWMNG